MDFSMGEAEVMAKKAVRGAGYPWGLAEEAGYATAWLTAQGCDGCRILVRLLKADCARNLAAHSPAPDGQHWHARGTPPGTLCPLVTGAALIDHCPRIDQPLTLHRVLEPTLLLAFVRLAAARRECCLRVEYHGHSLSTDGLQLSSLPPDVPQAEDVTLRIDDGILASRPSVSRCRPAASVWKTLDHFAARTYAPATDESRRLGAGAGLTDND